MSPNHFDDHQQVFATIGWPTNAPVLNPMLPVVTGAPSAAAAELKRRFNSADQERPLRSIDLRATSRGDQRQPSGGSSRETPRLPQRRYGCHRAQGGRPPRAPLAKGPPRRAYDNQ